MNMAGWRAGCRHLLAPQVVVPVLFTFGLGAATVLVEAPTVQSMLVVLLALCAGVSVRSVSMAGPERDRNEELDRARRTLYAAKFALLDGADPKLVQPYALAASICNTLAHRAQLLTWREANELGERLSRGTLSIRDVDELIEWLTDEIGDMAPEVSAELVYEDEPQPMRRVVGNT